MKRLMRSAAAIICAALFFWGAGCTAQSVNPEPQHTHTILPIGRGMRTIIGMRRRADMRRKSGKWDFIS